MTAMPLRPYQQEALDAVLDGFARGIRRPLVAHPTGTGKTVLFAHLLRQRPGRALVLAHRDELIQQAVEKLTVVDPALDIGIVKAERDEHDAPVVVASVQTLSRPARLERITPDFATVVVDEAHHATADTYRRILEYCGVFNPDGPLCLGLTATPFRADGAGLGQIFQETVHHRSILEMIQPGYLADLRALQIQLDCDLNQLHTRHGDFIESESSALLVAGHAPKHAVEAYQAYAAERKALLFTPTVELAHAMAEAFQAADIAAEALDGTTPVLQRREILQRLHRGETRVLCNCAVLTEGYDEASVDCIIVARPTKSKPLYVQMIGRGTRPFPGKDDCLILDLVGATSRHDLMTAATLFDLKPSALAGQTVTEAVEARDLALAARQPDGRVVGVPVDLFQRRPLHWLRVSESGYALPLGQGWASLTTEGERWGVQVIEPSGERRTLASQVTLPYAQGIAEDYARSVGAGGLVNPHAHWRQRPVEAYPKMHSLLLRWGQYRPGLTAGEASDLISTRKLERLQRVTASAG